MRCCPRSPELRDGSFGRLLGAARQTSGNNPSVIIDTAMNGAVNPPQVKNAAPTDGPTEKPMPKAVSDDPMIMPLLDGLASSAMAMALIDARVPPLLPRMRARKSSVSSRTGAFEGSSSM